MGSLKMFVFIYLMLLQVVEGKEAYKELGAGRCGGDSDARWLEQSWNEKHVQMETLEECQAQCDTMEKCNFVSYDEQQGGWCSFWSDCSCNDRVDTDPLSWMSYKTYEKAGPKVCPKLESVGSGRCGGVDNENWLEYDHRTIIQMKSLEWCKQQCYLMDKCKFISYDNKELKYCSLLSGENCNSRVDTVAEEYMSYQSYAVKY